MRPRTHVAQRSLGGASTNGNIQIDEQGAEYDHISHKKTATSTNAGTDIRSPKTGMETQCKDVS